MADLNTTAIIALQRHYRFQWEPAQESFVLLYPEGVVKLSGSAGEILKRVDGKSSADDIIRRLEEAFPGADLRNDVMQFLEVAYGNGWIRTQE
jgi:pyrroloquinoline quinone biosynthesis protein D